MFGWAALEVFKVIRACNHFMIAYNDGPDGAKAHFSHLQEQMENCKGVLEEITEELKSQDKKIYIGLQSLTATLKECASLFESAGVYFAKKEATIVRKAVGAAKYMWSGQDDLNRISKNLEGHIKYIGVFLQLVQRLVHILYASRNRLKQSQEK